MALVHLIKIQPPDEVQKNLVNRKTQEWIDGRCTSKCLAVSTWILCIGLLVASTFFLLDPVGRSSLSQQLDKVSDGWGESREIFGCSDIPKDERVDCHPEDGASELSCTARGCCWKPLEKKNFVQARKVPLDVPYCYYPQGWDIYELVNATPTTSFWKNTGKSAYKKDIDLLRMDTFPLNAKALRLKVRIQKKKKISSVFFSISIS